jgi:hypothetical protein
MVDTWMTHGLDYDYIEINALFFFDTWLIDELKYDQLKMNALYFFDTWLTHEQCEIATISACWTDSVK